MSSRDHPIFTYDLNSLWWYITLYSTLPWVLGTIQYLPMIWTPCGATLHCTLHSHEFQGPSNTYSWSKLNIWYHTTLCSTPPLIPGTTQYLPMIWTPCGDTLHCTLHSHEFQGPSRYWQAAQFTISMTINSNTVISFTRIVRILIENIIWTILFRNAYHKGINTKHPDVVLSSADTSIKVTIDLYCVPLV